MALDTLSVALALSYQWQAAKKLTGAGYQPTSNNSQPSKTVTLGNTVANNAAGGSDELYSALVTVSASANSLIDLTNLIDIVGTASVSLARLKALVVRLMSSTDDATNGTNASAVKVNAPVLPPVQNNVTTSGSGGSVAANTYYYVVTAITAAGETTISNEKSIVTSGATSSNTLSWVLVTNATGYRVYRTTSAGTYGASSFIAAVGSGATVTYLDTAAATTAGTPATVNTAAVANLATAFFNSPQSGLVVKNGEVVFWGTPSAAGITVDGTHKIISLDNQDGALSAKVQLTLVGGST